MRWFGTAILATMIASPAFAQNVDQAPAPRIEVDARALDRDMITIGGGIGLVPSYEGSNDYVLLPVGAVRGQVAGINFMSRGLQLSADVLRVKSSSGIDLMLGPVAGLNFNRTNRIVDSQVSKLGNRRAAVEAGGYAGISKTGVFTSDFDILAVRASYVRDVTNVSNSYVLTTSIDYGSPLSKQLFVGVSGSASIAGDRYAQTYFAVDPAGAVRSGLPVFDRPRGGLKNLSATVLADYALSGDLQHGLQLVGLLSYSRLQGDFARSPITSVAGSPNQFYAALGIGYTF